MIGSHSQDDRRSMKMNIWKIIYLNCEERYEFTLVGLNPVQAWIFWTQRKWMIRELYWSWSHGQIFPSGAIFTSLLVLEIPLVSRKLPILCDAEFRTYSFLYKVMESEHPFLTDCNVATFFLSYAIATTSDDRAFLRKLKCHYVVLDEGHMLKNMQSQRYQGLMKVKVGVLCCFSVVIQLLCPQCSTNDAGNRTISQHTQKLLCLCRE